MYYLDKYFKEVNRLYYDDISDFVMDITDEAINEEQFLANTNKHFINNKIHSLLDVLKWLKFKAFINTGITYQTIINNLNLPNYMLFTNNFDLELIKHFTTFKHTLYIENLNHNIMDTPINELNGINIYAGLLNYSLNVGTETFNESLLADTNRFMKQQAIIKSTGRDIYFAYSSFSIKKPTLAIPKTVKVISITDENNFSLISNFTKTTTTNYNVYTFNNHCSNPNSKFGIRLKLKQ